MKKALLLVVSVIFLTSMIAGCSTANTATTSEEKTETTTAVETTATQKTQEFTFGNLAWSLADEWNQYGVEAFKWKAAKMGVKVEVLDCQKNPEEQIAQAQDFINKGVSGISIFPCSPDTGATVTRMSNEAGIPIAIENIFLPEDGSAGKVVGQVACRYEDIGYAAVEYAATKWPGSKLLYVHGGPGVGVYEAYQIGVDKALEKYKDDIELVGLVNGNWETEASYNVTIDFINKGTSKFDVVFANNDLQAVGVYNALKEAGMEGIPIISTGGSLQGYEMVMNGQEAANMTAPVNIQGIIVFDFLYKTVTGAGVKNPHIPLPVIPVGKDNIQDWIKWDDNEAAQKYIDEHYDI
jgi:ABC-type sugar transport system substrate-binding protein